MKKIIPVVVIISILLIAGVVVFMKSHKVSNPATSDSSTQKHHISDPVNIIAASERPYMQVLPKDIHNVAIMVNDVKKPATSAEYEIEYQTDSSLQGAQGSFSLSPLPASTKNILLGSCSAGGACTYHKNVQGGTILMKFTGVAEDYTLKTEWNYIDNTAKDSKFSSKDAKFQLTSTDLSSEKLLVIYNSPGYPAGLSGTPESDPYTLDGMTPYKGKGTLQMRANDLLGSASIMGWDGKTWHEFVGKVDGKSVTADVDLMQLYIVVKK